MKGYSETLAIIILLLVTLGMAVGIYTILTGSSVAQAATIEEVTGYCTNHTATFVIRNGENTPLSRSSFVCTKITSGCGQCVVDENFPSGGAGYVKVYDCSSGTHTFYLKTTYSSLQLTVYCK